MRNKVILCYIVFLIALLFPSSDFVLGKDTRAKKLRWDQVMINEAPIWKNLLVCYYYAEHRKHWPRRKAALEKVLDRFPKSRWADDAALILACGKAGFEDDPNGAIKDLQEIGNQYPNSGTVVVAWQPKAGCGLDGTWLMWRGGLVVLNKDGTIRIAWPFDRYGRIYHLEKEALTYFEHLEKHPRRTRVLAQIFISHILAYKGDFSGAIIALKKVAVNSGGLANTLRADAIAGLQPTGYYIRNLFRPECEAYMSLINYYGREGQTNKALKKADELAALVNRTPNWHIIKRLGTFYEKRGLSIKAVEQYRLALVGIKQHMQADKERYKHLEHDPKKKAEASPHLKREAVELENLIKKGSVR